MLDFNNKNRHSRSVLARFFLSQKILALFGLIIIVALAIPMIKNFNQRRSIEGEINGAQAEINRVENKNNELRNLIDYFKSNQFLEESARLNFGLKKNGESVAVIKEGALNTDSSTSTDPLNPSDQKTVFNIPGMDKLDSSPANTNLSKWLQYFFNR